MPRLTHCSLIDIEHGRFCRAIATTSERNAVYSEPLAVWRNVPSSETESVTKAEPPSSICSAAPEPASHSLTVLSPDADASCLPSGEKATAKTQSEWPSS